MEENNNFNGYNSENIYNDYNNEQNWDNNPNMPYPPYNPYFVQQDSEEDKEKKSLRKMGLVIGIPSIAISGISYIWAYVYLFITMNIFKMSYNDAVEITQDPAAQQVIQITLSCLMFLVPFIISTKCLKLKIGELIMFNKAKKGTFLPFVLFGIGFCSFANISLSLSSSLFEGFGVEYKVDFGENPEGVFGFLLSFIATAIVPAIVEEFACRGIVLGLLKKHGEGFAIIASSIVFGIMHGNFEQIPFATIVGLVFGYVYVKTGSIWASMLVHCVNNAVAVIYSYLPNTVNANITYIIFLAISLLIAIIGVLWFAKKTDENYEIEKSNSKLSEKQKYISLFTSWAIILFICLNIYEALSYFDVFKLTVQRITESIGL